MVTSIRLLWGGISVAFVIAAAISYFRMRQQIARDSEDRLRSKLAPWREWTTWRQRLFDSEMSVSDASKSLT